MTTLVPAAEVHGRALEILARERARLGPLLPPHELVLTGGSSLPGAVTKGDVDLHLRVDAADFAATVALLRRTYTVVHPDIWAPTLATFAVTAPLPTGVAVTPIGSGHDVRFVVTWQVLAARPDLLEEYNAIKRAAPDDYGHRTSALFDRIVAEAGRA